MSVGGSVRGENPSRLVFTSAQANKIQGFVLSFPLFRLSRSENLPRVRAIRVRRETPARRRYTAEHPRPRGCSSAGRAPALQAGGQRFESAHLHQHIDNRIGLSRSPECRKAINWILFFSCRGVLMLPVTASAVEEWL